MEVQAVTCKALDREYSFMVSGKTWLNKYLDSLVELSHAKVIYSEGQKVFQFEEEARLKSYAVYVLPAFIVRLKLALWIRTYCSQGLG